MELLSFNNPAQSELDSFALEWSKIATPTTINNSNTHTSSLNMGNLPSQLLDTQNFQSQNFPNPFTDSNFSVSFYYSLFSLFSYELNPFYIFYVNNKTKIVVGLEWFDIRIRIIGK